MHKLQPVPVKDKFIFYFAVAKLSYMKTVVKTKSVYEKPLQKDGCRVLIDRLWPRGLTKERVAYNSWVKDLAPSTSLRKWYGHAPELWEDFQKRYKAELKTNDAVEPFVEEHKDDKVITLLYAAKDREHTHALVLQTYLQHQFDKD